MKRTIATVATLLVSLSAATSFAQQYPQQYPPQQPQQYPPQQQYPQQYPQQQYPQQQYPQQGFQQQGGFQPAPYVPAGGGAPQVMFGNAGQFILSADRLFGLYFWSSKIDLDNGAEVSQSGTAINLLWGDSQAGVSGTIGGGIPAPPNGPYQIPRLGLDYTVANNISVGGSIGLISRSGSVESKPASGASASSDTPSFLAFAIAPRFGYILGINQTIGVWFKGGITYFTGSTEAKSPNQTTTVTFSGFSLNLEPALVITPVQRFGFTVGGLADIALSGNAKGETTGVGASSAERPSKINNFGISLGIVGFI